MSADVLASGMTGDDVIDLPRLRLIGHMLG